jgi:hypothetical protein
MIRQLEAEFLRFKNKRSVFLALLIAVLFAGIGTTGIFASAKDAAAPDARRAVTFALLESHGGGTESFTLATTFLGPFVLVTFAALIAGEFSGGTFRALLLRNAKRRSLLAGKVLGIYAVAALLVLFTEILCFGMSLALAPAYDVSVNAWFGIDSFVDAASNYAKVMTTIGGFAIFGATLGVIFRSTPIAIGVGIIWTGPFEIVVDSWNTGYRVFPGQVLSAITQGGTVDISLERALITAASYAAVATTIALTLVKRRDVTS